MKTLSVRLSDEVHDRLRQEAERRGMRLSDVVRIRLAAGGSPWEWHTSQPGAVRSLSSGAQTRTNYPVKNIQHDPERDK